MDEGEVRDAARVQGWLARARGRLATPAGRLATRVLRWALVSGVVLFLADHLADVGWNAVLAALPTDPLFYLLFVAIYAAIPLSELLIYRRLWGFPVARSWPIFLRKRVYNVAVLGYAGEVVLYAWARRHTGLPDRTLVSTIKDNAILSAMASNLATLVLLAGFLATGQASKLAGLDQDAMRGVSVVAAVSLALLPLFLLFHRRIMAVDRRTARDILAIHIARQLLVLVLQVLQWALLFPHAPLNVWLVFLTAQMVLSRVPGLPNQDLLFLALGVSLAGVVDAPTAAVTAMFVATGVLAQLANLAVYVATSFGQFAPRRTAALQEP